MQSSYWECFKSDISRLWQEKKLQIKKNAKESRGALSLSEKKWCLWPSLLQLLYIRDLRFSWREILGKFSLLDYFKNSFIDIVCIVTAFLFGGGLEKVKETSICFEQKANRNAFSHFYQCSTFDDFLADSHETRKIVTAWDVLSKDICSRVWPTLDRLMFLK